jgi:hypothetical protein
VVGLVINSLNKTVIIADPNGALIGGSNMEFLTMPLTKLQSEPTTTLSFYKTTKIITEEGIERSDHCAPTTGRRR